MVVDLMTTKEGQPLNAGASFSNKSRLALPLVEKVRMDHCHISVLGRKMAEEHDVDVRGLDEGVDADILKLESQDSQQFDVPRNIALGSELVRTMCENGMV